MPAHPLTLPATGRHALVTGGSIAGLLAARVLADHGARVTVVERDVLPVEPAGRKGTPQARHVHVLLTRGQEMLERLFPGLEAELAAAGAVQIDWTADTAWLTPAGWGYRFPSHLRTFASSRDLLEWLIRRRLATDPRVCFLTGHEVVGLLRAEAGAAVAGARVRPRGNAGDGAGAAAPLRADLVVDAGGRGSRAPAWLAEIGYAAPAETVVNAFLGYASRLYARPAGSSGDWKALYLQSRPPQLLRGGVILPIEGERWLVTLAGAGRDYPPADATGFLEFARSLASPALYEAIRAATPLAPITTYRATENRVRHFERLARWPDGFIVAGDAACAFNPVYGQGMTTAALSAVTLDECLRGAARAGGDWRGLARRFQRLLARRNQAPWLLATGADLQVPQTVGRRPGGLARLSLRYFDHVLARATHDPTVRLALMDVLHLVRPPAALFQPHILWRVLSGQRAAESPAPPVLSHPERERYGDRTA
jgi:2-polyprenyl-6-methoxyphenol hydroxylase-like FAD-dependent oxidoreductase